MIAASKTGQALSGAISAWTKRHVNEIILEENPASRSKHGKTLQLCPDIPRWIHHRGIIELRNHYWY